MRKTLYKFRELDDKRFIELIVPYLKIGGFFSDAYSIKCFTENLLKNL
ncbi:MAG: hypothetical protein NC934_00670 [Candidatus Omnitrophica bacterium]|nr:hypothetical protein [Candidatus Omnitrophota bacterium]